jgi:hypothetical protein
MNNASKDSLLVMLDNAREEYLRLLESVPESDYSKASGNEAWTVGDVLFHITLGPRALALEAWMILHARGVFQLAMNFFPSRTFNRVNAWFARRDTRGLSRDRLAKGYEKGHAALRSVLMRAGEEQFAKSVIYPQEFVSELAGEVTVERLIQYAFGHVELHAKQIRAKE